MLVYRKVGFRKSNIYMLIFTFYFLCIWKEEFEIVIIYIFLGNESF